MWDQWNIILDIQLIHLQCVAGYGSLPRANHSAPLSDSRLDGGLLVDTPLSSPYCPDNTLPLLETVSEDQEICNKHRTPVLASQGTPSVHCSERPGGCFVSELMPSFLLLAHTTSYFSNFFSVKFSCKSSIYLTFQNHTLRCETISLLLMHGYKNISYLEGRT